MAEQYMSRRERKEAEKRAAEAQKLKEAAETPVAEETAPAVSTPAKPQTPPNTQPKADQQAVEKEPTPVEPPQFASRAERKAWMRKHGQAAAVADEPDLTLGRQSKQEPTPAPKETEAKQAEAKKPEEQKTATKKPEAKKPEPKKPEAAKSASKTADAKKPEAKKSEAKKPVPAKPTTQPGVAQSAAKAPAEKKPADKKPVEKPAEQKKAVEKKTTAEKQSESKPVVAKPAQTPQANKKTSEEDKSADSTNKKNADKKSGDAPTVASRSRKAPVVKPPNTEGIRVVSGAVPVVDPESKGEGDTKQDSVSTDEARSRASSFATRPLESVEEDPEVTREEWPLNDAIGVAQPMSARSVTHQDGEILVGERSSVLPYIVLGVGGLCAIVLVVVALIMLF